MYLGYSQLGEVKTIPFVLYSPLGSMVIKEGKEWGWAALQTPPLASDLNNQ